jgi:hypothetical protein
VWEFLLGNIAVVVTVTIGVVVGSAFFLWANRNID